MLSKTLKLMFYDDTRKQSQPILSLLQVEYVLYFASLKPLQKLTYLILNGVSHFVL